MSILICQNYLYWLLLTMIRLNYTRFIIFIIVLFGIALCDAVDDVVVPSGKMLKIACIATQRGSSGRCSWKTNKNEVILDKRPSKPRSNVAIVGDVAQGDCSLLISGIRVKDSGVWQCTFFPNIVKEYNVTVTGEIEKVVLMYKNKVVTGGETIMIDPETEARQAFTCLIELVVGIPKFKWFIDGLGAQPAIERKPSKGSVPNSRRFVSTLSIAPPDLVSGKSDKLKQIKCAVSFTSTRKVQQEDTVHIGKKNPVTKIKGTYVKNVDVDDEAIADIYCESDGQPKPESHEYAILFRRSLTHPWEVAVQSQNYTLRREGQYVCLVQNEPMQATNKWISSEPMHIGKKVPIHYAIVYLHSHGIVSCSSEIPSEKCAWSKDNAMVAGTEIPTYNENYVVTGNSSEGECTLTISEVTQEDQGVWRCQFFPPGESIIQDFQVVVV